MPWTAAAGMAIGGLLGGAAQGGISYASAKQQQQAQKEAYQKRYQWTVQDLRHAGLNPVLAAQHGAGNVGPMSQMDSSGISSAVQAASQIGLQNAQADAASAAAEVANQDAAKRSWEAISAQVKGQMDEMSYNYLAGHNKGPDGGPMTSRQKAIALLNAGQLSGLPASSLAAPAASAYGSTIQAGASLLPMGKVLEAGRKVIKGFGQ